jgi:hypothetical protein
VAEYERTLIADRMRRGRQIKYRAGKLLPWTHVPFGYRVDPDHPREPQGVRMDESEATWIQEMFTWYGQEGRSLIGLAKHLQESTRIESAYTQWQDTLESGRVAGHSAQPRLHWSGLRQSNTTRRSSTAPITNTTYWS